MTETNPLSIAYEFIDSDAEVHGRDGMVAMWDPMDDTEETVVVYEHDGTDCDPRGASLHLSIIDRWSFEEVEDIYWANEDIDPTITAESGPAAEFYQ